MRAVLILPPTTERYERFRSTKNESSDFEKQKQTIALKFENFVIVKSKCENEILKDLISL